MKKIILSLIVILISFDICYSWWNESWSFCRDITLNEVSGITRLYEPIDIFVDSSDWNIRPNKSSIRIISGDCSGIGNEIKYGLWNETFDENNFLLQKILKINFLFIMISGLKIQ